MPAPELRLVRMRWSGTPRESPKGACSRSFGSRTPFVQERLPRSVTRLTSRPSKATDPPPSRRLPLAYRPPAIGFLTAFAGLAVLALGLLSVEFAPHPVYTDLFTGAEAPFDATAGLLLLGLSPRIRDRSPIAWLFSLLAPTLTAFIAILSPNAFSIASAAIAMGVVAFIYPYRAGFYRGLAVGPEATQLAVLVAALLSVLFGLVGAHLLAGQFTPTIGGWSGALFFTISTISTTGSPYSPTTDAARDFETLLILLGVGTFLTAVLVLFLPFLERRLRSIAVRLERTQMEDLKDHIIICGLSPEACESAAALRELGIRTVLLSPDEKHAEVVRGQGYRTHIGDPSSEEVLRFVGLARARAFVAALDSDAENLLAVITARGLRPDLRIVAVAKHAQSLPKFEKAGANRTINTVQVAARLVSTAVLERSLA